MTDIVKIFRQIQSPRFNEYSPVHMTILKEVSDKLYTQAIHYSTLAGVSHDAIENESSDEGSLFHALRKRKGNLGFIHAFIASLSVIIVSELGDKTFFIAAIMAMRHSRVTVLAGALGALALMTVLSGFDMSPDEAQEEYEELQKQNAGVQDVETGIIRTPGRRFLQGVLGTIFLQAFTLTFLAEWGDRSQLTTIVLAAREDLFGVILGGVLGHAICTGIAVLGGRIVAQKISVRTVTLIGGVSRKKL
ncbi:hypothetical protein KUTeg_024740 [Tegillarca granosa]|uniref:GDT1 family protein n=1 Tax=Tegillarca granosa TaxID=220873 RepID=A0ABQ9DYR5_TEGGR|nr:hypothetical protein KUTeg_024740 [Tegillarca granosa]